MSLIVDYIRRRPVFETFVFSGRLIIGALCSPHLLSARLISDAIVNELCQLFAEKSSIMAFVAESLDQNRSIPALSNLITQHPEAYIFTG